jgi:hypothetical protein
MGLGVPVTGLVGLVGLGQVGIGGGGLTGGLTITVVGPEGCSGPCGRTEEAPCSEALAMVSHGADLDGKLQTCVTSSYTVPAGQLKWYIA